MSSYRKICNELGENLHVVLVNDGSTRGVTNQDIKALEALIKNFTYLHYNENKGKGYALRHGIAGVETDIIIYTDIDFPYTTDSLLNLYNTLKDKATDIAIGVKDDVYYKSVPPARKYISRILRKMTTIFLRIPVTDTQCGLKGFRLNAKNVFLETSIKRYLFDLEFIKSAYAKKLSITPIPVKLRDNITFSKMNYKILLPELLNFMMITIRNK